MVSMLNLWRACSIYGEQAQFMVSMLNLWSVSSIYDEHAQFMVSMLNLWWACSMYGQHAQFMVSMLNLWWACSIDGEHAQIMLSMLNLWKTTPKWLFDCPNPSSGSKDTVIMILKSADLYSHSWFDIPIGLALKNYPKMTFRLPKSLHWIVSYGHVFFHVS